MRIGSARSVTRKLPYTRPVQRISNVSIEKFFRILAFWGGFINFHMIYVDVISILSGMHNYFIIERAEL